MGGRKRTDQERRRMRKKMNDKRSRQSQGFSQKGKEPHSMKTKWSQKVQQTRQTTWVTRFQNFNEKVFCKFFWVLAIKALFWKSSTYPNCRVISRVRMKEDQQDWFRLKINWLTKKGPKRDTSRWDFIGERRTNLGRASELEWRLSTESAGDLREAGKKKTRKHDH